jgi:hypothetical protein
MEYEGLTFCLRHISRGKSSDYPTTRLSMNNKNFEIIGNIYENANLLSVRDRNNDS